MIEQSIKILGDLIAFPTVSSESNRALIDYVVDYLTPLGAQIDIQFNDDQQKANLFATFGELADGGIVLSGHSDVVPVVGQPWTRDPFSMHRDNARLYGRGTCDMKGFIACVLAMAPRFAQGTLSRPLHIAITYDEECGCYGAKALAQLLSQKAIRPRVAIIGEPTEMKVIDAHKGVCEYTTRFRGLAGHGSSPEKGVNAVEYAARYVVKLLELREQLIERSPADQQFEPPWTTINIGALRGGEVHNVIADSAEVLWEMRPVQPDDYALVHNTLKEYADQTLLPAMQNVEATAQIETQTVGDVVGLAPATLNEARDICCALTGNSTTSSVPFGTEAGIYQELGIDAVVCGPGSIAQAHTADEYIEIAEMERCIAMLEQLETQLSLT